MSTSSEFLCKCKEQKGWITEGRNTLPCPKCGRVYIGYYDKENLTVSGRELTKSKVKRWLKKIRYFRLKN